ncbi:MAG: FIST N-terminal domain-containing protein, partial [Mycobacteriales bacterium]
MRDRWMSAGRSADPDAWTAGAEAAGNAIAGRTDPRLLIIFASDAYDLSALLGGIDSVAPDLPLVGCSTAGEIATTGPGDSGVV